ncbi:hypothetical protein HYH03_000172 [Edaphochlamys debaryana]|uniref:Uncharacterized protein n=1 Tax=Edaphochlamys debaryana TaxID=47281 RepID=A0A836C762_9CHLO|nr:hypothetical protein HYH03_000172 [Edaphochlamys debaryana]|eukprot:KAG2501669.1 hypothetical protein HYH03_000172 [Edaphochlamys debaryana]
MSAPCVANKKRPAADAAAGQCAKKCATSSVAAPTPAGVSGWQYPPLPMGMMPPMAMGGMPFCMPTAPFFPFMGMGMMPPFMGMMLPGMAMAAAAASASAAGMAGACGPVASMSHIAGMPGCGWPMPFTAPATAAVAPARSNSGLSSAVPSASCAQSVLSSGIQSPASPPPIASSPGSVCNDSSERPPEDDEFAEFIANYLQAGESDPDAGLKMFSIPSNSGHSECSDDTTDNEPTGLTRSDSLLNLLGGDLPELSGLC